MTTPETTSEKLLRILNKNKVFGAKNRNNEAKEELEFQQYCKTIKRKFKCFLNSPFKTKARKILRLIDWIYRFLIKKILFEDLNSGLHKWINILSISFWGIALLLEKLLKTALPSLESIKIYNQIIDYIVFCAILLASFSIVLYIEALFSKNRDPKEFIQRSCYEHDAEERVVKDLRSEFTSSELEALEISFSIKLEDASERKEIVLELVPVLTLIALVFILGLDANNNPSTIQWLNIAIGGIGLGAVISAFYKLFMLTGVRAERYSCRKCVNLLKRAQVEIECKN